MWCLCHAGTFSHTTTIGLIGDTQGRFDVAALIASVARHFEGVDEVWHAGDWQYPEVLTLLSQIAPLTVVNGNAPDDPSQPERVLREVDGLRVGMVHRPPKKGDAWAAATDICIHGHTHRWRDETVGGTRFINVSTPTLAPRDNRTIGILRLTDGHANLERIVLQP